MEHALSCLDLHKMHVSVSFFPSENSVYGQIQVFIIKSPPISVALSVGNMTSKNLGCAIFPWRGERQFLVREFKQSCNPPLLKCSNKTILVPLFLTGSAKYFDLHCSWYLFRTARFCIFNISSLCLESNLYQKRDILQRFQCLKKRKKEALF